MVDHVVTGKMPENWTGRVPAALKRPQLSEWLKRGRSAVTTVENPLEGESFFKTGAHQSKADREQGKTRERLNVQFGKEEVREAATEVQEFLAAAEYTYSFEPTNSDMISLLEYDDKRQLLRATFSNNGSVVVYRHIPINVYARLQYVNNSGQSVGGAFWDLVRIYDRRGMPVGGPYYPKQSNFVREGGKTAFTYEERGASLGPRPNSYAAANERREAEQREHAQRMQSLASELAKGEYVDPKEFRKNIKDLVDYVQSNPSDSKTREYLRQVYEGMKSGAGKVRGVGELTDEQESELYSGGYQFVRKGAHQRKGPVGTTEGVMRALRQREREEERNR